MEISSTNYSCSFDRIDKKSVIILSLSASIITITAITAIGALTVWLLNYYDVATLLWISPLISSICFGAGGLGLSTAIIGSLILTVFIIQKTLSIDSKTMPTDFGKTHSDQLTIDLNRLSSAPRQRHIKELTIDLGVLITPPRIHTTHDANLKYSFPNVKTLNVAFSISQNVDPSQPWNPNFSGLNNRFILDAQRSTPVHYVFTSI